MILAFCLRENRDLNKVHEPMKPARKEKAPFRFAGARLPEKRLARGADNGHKWPGGKSRGRKSPGRAPSSAAVFTPSPVSVLQQKIDFTGEESCLSFYRRTAARGAAGLSARTAAPRRPCL